MAAREREERLVVGAMREIGLEQALDGRRRVLRLHVAIDLPRQRRIGPEAATDMDVIALDGVAVVGACNLAGEEADVANVVLRAGMVAAGEVDVEGTVESDARLAPARDLLGVTFRVRGGEAAADVAGAGHEPRAN